MIDSYYGAFANKISHFLGSVWSLAILLILIAVTGLYFDFSLAWETHLVTVLGFLALVAILFLQRSQRHGDRATHIKLDELIRAAEGARNEVAAVEKQAEEVIDDIAPE
ncbi:MAG TPA: low affinity iron permease family protein [Pyrinomonadaceae bacterium]|jgi:low affinity Fe/Cu permease|nr:low affinity iron permease family protein [Pyrinomonadaceae bacterium]